LQNKWPDPVEAILPKRKRGYQTTGFQYKEKGRENNECIKYEIKYLFSTKCEKYFIFSNCILIKNV
jgi:hypothetical protein